MLNNPCHFPSLCCLSLADLSAVFADSQIFLHSRLKRLYYKYINNLSCCCCYMLSSCMGLCNNELLYSFIFDEGELNWMDSIIFFLISHLPYRILQLLIPAFWGRDGLPCLFCLQTEKRQYEQDGTATLTPGETVPPAQEGGTDLSISLSISRGKGSHAKPLASKSSLPTVLSARLHCPPCNPAQFIHAFIQWC